MFDKVAKWSFLQEPAYRWFIFFGAMIFMFACWSIIIGYMRKAG